MHNRAPIGKTKYRVSLNEGTNIDVIASDENDAKEQVNTYLKGNNHNNVLITNVKILKGKCHYNTE